METPRPIWNHKTPEDIARGLLQHSVTAITLHSSMIDNDNTEEWLELHDDPTTMICWGKAPKKASLRVPVGFLNDKSHSAEVTFNPDYRSLVVVRDGLRSTVIAIDAWEKKNQRDRSEFERLKRKFEGAR